MPAVGLMLSQTPSGKITDDRGMTLYTFDNDGTDKSNCNGQCAVNWPPLLTPVLGLASVPDELKSGMTYFLRDDGKTQAAYKGMPLYYYISDSNPGDMKGDGIGGVWHMAGIVANRPTTTTSTTSSTAPTQPTSTLQVTTSTLAGTGRKAYVKIGVYNYDPRYLTVNVGDTVVWTSLQTRMTVTSSGNGSDRELDSPVLGPQESYAHTFTKAGAYSYYSTTNDRVNGRIYVNEALNVTR